MRERFVTLYASRPGLVPEFGIDIQQNKVGLHTTSNSHLMMVARSPFLQAALVHCGQHPPRNGELALSGWTEANMDELACQM